MWKPKFYILYSYDEADKLKWPDGWHECLANIPTMLQKELKTKAVGGEIKLIWNDAHRRSIIDRWNVTSKEIDEYVQAKSCMLSFMSAGTRARAAKELARRGMDKVVFVEDYKDVILYQSHFKVNGCFPGPGSAFR